MIRPTRFLPAMCLVSCLSWATATEAQIAPDHHWVGFAD